jgi:uncharacterized Zn finger protein (UPF0148 family)
MEDRICPSCGYLMLLDDDGWWYCDYCGNAEEDLEEDQYPQINT